MPKYPALLPEIKKAALKGTAFTNEVGAVKEIQVVVSEENEDKVND